MKFGGLGGASLQVLTLLTAAEASSNGLSTRSATYLNVCKEIADSISSQSEVFYPLSLQYAKDKSHWATSSSQESACTVEPGTTEDLGAILVILGSTQTPFSVKGGGHATNAGFSSSDAVQIAMYRFSNVDVNQEASTANIGMGLIWDDVYAKLEPYSVNVVGGRVTGVGVGGFALGGGYSWLTNQYGLTLDNILAYSLVLPNGTFVEVTGDNYPDLFWGLKGGFNNFGIVTQITMKTYPQTEVWGGVITYTFNEVDTVTEAVYNFSLKNTDPKAQIITTYNFLLGEIGVSQLIFYDEPYQPEGIFDEFMAIPHFTESLSVQTFSSLVLSSPANATANQRALFNTAVSTSYTPAILAQIVNQTTYWGEHSTLYTGTFISYDVEPFLPSIFLHAPANSSAYPPDRSVGLLPLNLYYAYEVESADEFFLDAIVESARVITETAVAEGQDIVNAAVYPNYAVAGTPLDRMYGDNMEALQTLKQQYDPHSVMNLCGGWRF